MIEFHVINRFFEVGDQQVHALDSVELNIKHGEYVSIMGPSGSGKSTLLNIIGLLDRPTSGKYLLDGEDVTDFDDKEQARNRRDKIGFVFQVFHLVPRLTAAENVELPLILAGIDPEERKRRVAHSLKDFNLSDRSDHRPNQLSGGQQQRVAIARATIMEPAMILADEPTGNLDQASGRAVLDILELLNDRGMTLLVVTHDENISRRARRNIRMLDGAIVADTLTRAAK